MTEPPVYDGPLAGVALLAAWLLTTFLLLRPRSWARRPDHGDDRRDST